jgi:mRNA-degrading endonuclease RelE of RelBE toxin-antitoxin system
MLGSECPSNTVARRYPESPHLSAGEVQINQQLIYEPTVETQNRKPLRPNPLASWELRIGDLRVYYDVEEDPERHVDIVAIGIKRRNRVYIAGELYDL